MPCCYAGPVRLVRKCMILSRHGTVSKKCKASWEFRSSIMEITRFKNAEGAKAPKPSKTTNYTILINMLLPCDLLSSRPLHQDQIVPVTTQSERPVPDMPQCPRVRKLIGVPWPITGDPQFVVLLVLGYAALLWVRSSLCKMSKTKRCKTSVDGGKSNQMQIRIL